LHFPVVFPILDSLPDWITLRVKPELRPVVGIKYDLAKQVRDIRDGLNEGHKAAAHATIFHEMLNSDQPESEKTDARLGDEAQLIVAAGLVTTSRALTVGSYHLIANPTIVANLRAELQGADINLNQLDWNRLVSLPYLHGIVHESIRLAHEITTRSPRLAPDQELRYGEYVIARNTPVSMTTVDILMNPRVFPEPREFKPERWIEGGEELKRYFVAFGRGARGCMGIK
jgi:cytochrome P450